MAELFSLIFQFLMFLALLLIGYLFGRAAEKRHYASIQEREHTYRKLLLFSERFPPGSLMHCDSELVKGSTVISVDKASGNPSFSAKNKFRLGKPKNESMGGATFQQFSSK